MFIVFPENAGVNVISDILKPLLDTNAKNRSKSQSCFLKVKCRSYSQVMMWLILPERNR